MPDQRFPLIVILRPKGRPCKKSAICLATIKSSTNSYTNDGSVIRKDTIKSPTDSCTFNSVLPGHYTVFGLFADGSKTTDRSFPFFSTASSLTCYLKPEYSKICVSPPDPPQITSTAIRSKLPVKAIAGFAIPAALMSHFGGAAPLIKEISNTLLRPRIASSGTQASYRNAFSSRVKTQLKTCVKNNVRDFSQIPTLSKLLESASWEREVEGEFEQQIIDLYADYGQLRTTINKCDPRLAQEVLAARANIAKSNENTTVFVTGQLVNVRVAPNGQIIKSLPYGTPVLLDQVTTAGLSEDQKLAIKQGAGWQPIILSTGEAGYVYSLYISDPL